MSSLKTNNISNLNGTLTIPTDTAIDLIDNGTAKAWVNFNGTGTVAIRAAYNVTSITDNGTGWYTINFTNAMADTNYCTVATIGTPGLWSGGLNVNTNNGAAEVAPTLTAVSIVTVQYNAAANLDAKYFHVTIFR